MAAIRRIMFPLALAALPAGASAQNPNIILFMSDNGGLAARYPGKVRRLSRRLGRYLRSVGADRPAFKESGRECPWPDEIDSEK